MQSLRTMFIIALGLTLAVCAADYAAAGEKAEEILASYSLQSLDGKEARLSSFRGEIVVVNFWASWCAPCRKELPIMDAWHQAWSGRGARVVAISVDKEQRKAKRFAEETNLSFLILHDGPSGLARTLDLPALPTTYLLDRDGSVVAVVRGSSIKELDALQQKVEFLLNRPRKPAVQEAGLGSPSPALEAAGDASDEGGER